MKTPREFTAQEFTFNDGSVVMSIMTEPGPFEDSAKAKYFKVREVLPDDEVQKWRDHEWQKIFFEGHEHNICMKVLLKFHEMEQKIETMPVITAEGIRFGDFCFISHDAIIEGRGPMVFNKYKEWLKGVLK